MRLWLNLIKAAIEAFFKIHNTHMGVHAIIAIRVIWECTQGLTYNISQFLYEALVKFQFYYRRDTLPQDVSKTLHEYRNFHDSLEPATIY